jgi:hypothetical protein
MLEGKRFRWEHDSYDIVFRAQDEKNSCRVRDLLTCWHVSKSVSNDVVISRFIKLNNKAFDFLGITPIKNENNISLYFKTSNYVGCVPLISPVTGKPYANLIVNGRFDEEVGEILPLLPDAINIDYENDLILPHQATVKPPIFYECIKYIEKYLLAQRTHWRKFINEQRIQPFPSSSTDWGKYAELSFSPDKIFRYPNKVNLLTTTHNEWMQINYVLKMCIEELNSNSTPIKTRISYKDRIYYLQKLLQTQSSIPTQELKIHSSDPEIIKELKIIGNRILAANGSEYHAWKVDFNKLFEQYVQFIIAKVSILQHAKSFNNIKFSISGNKTNWTLSHLEPDLIMKKDDRLIIIDAKYKTHMLNTISSNSDSLHDSFRHDLHQVLAYSSFDSTSNKITMLVYPNNSFRVIKQRISAPLSNVTNHVYLIGIPFGKIKDNDESKTRTIADNVNIAIEGIDKLLELELSAS